MHFWKFEAKTQMSNRHLIFFSTEWDRTRAKYANLARKKEIENNSHVNTTKYRSRIALSDKMESLIFQVWPCQLTKRAHVL